ncbi:hypothetical protein [Novosphingobium sp. 9]|uniref:hypothetical protein n=1 Tax=Novosphingobium sp. 9 TaxID=2025349 RepID=UPI0021B53D4A|nr:hypothetical protein [Novosphingobium sp. 9]
MALTILLAAQALTLHLLCPGQGLDTKVGVTSGQAFASNGASATANVYQRKTNAFDDEIEITLTNSTASVRLPRSIVPPIHGGKDGWFDVKDLKVTPDAIDGKVPINFTNAPRLHINRITGSVAIEGRDGSFNGLCHAYDPETVKHAF